MSKLYPKSFITGILFVLSTFFSFSAVNKSKIGKEYDNREKAGMFSERIHPVNSIVRKPLNKKRSNTIPAKESKEEHSHIETNLSYLVPKAARLLSTSLRQKQSGADPIHFTITTNKDSVSIGEEIEIKISAKLLPIPSNSMFFLPEWYGYCLKLILPDGFIQTGGDYHDYLRAHMDKGGLEEASYILKGHFEYDSREPVFKLIRGFEGTLTKGDFYLKGEKKLFIKAEDKHHRDELYLQASNDINTKGKANRVAVTLKHEHVLNATFSKNGVFDFCNQYGTFIVEGCPVSQEFYDNFSGGRFLRDYESKQIFKKNVKFYYKDVKEGDAVGDVAWIDYTDVLLNTATSNGSKIWSMKFNNENGIYSFNISETANGLSQSCSPRSTLPVDDYGYLYFTRYRKIVCNDNSSAESSNKFNRTKCLRAPAPTVSASSQTINQGESVTISANGCPQNYQVVWENDYIPKGISSTVMSLSDTKTFQAYCSPLDEGCSSEESNSITIAVNPCNNSSIASPAFSPSSATINLNESYTIQTNGICGANTFQWVSGPASNPVQRAGTYTAVCKNTAGCFSATSSFTLNVNNDPCVTATIASPVFSPSGATINEGQTYTLPTDVCNNGNRFEWRVAPPSNPVGVAGTYTAICKSIDGCVSGTSSFSLMVNGRTLNVSKSNPSCFNNDGSFQVTINGSSGENFLYTLINTANNQTIYGGQEDGNMHSFSGLPQGSYKILVQLKGTSVYYESYQTLTKSCSGGGIVISNKTNPNCLNGNGSFTVTVSNPTSGIGYVYYLINNNTNVQLDKKYNGSSNTFTGLSDGNYRVDVWEDRTGGGVINGNENVSLIKDCSGFSASISKNRDSNCGNRAGSVTITASGKSGGCYKYTLIGGQNQAYVKESGLISSNSWTVDDLPPGNYYAGVQFSQDCEHMSDMASTSSVALNKDCSDFTSLLSIVSLPNCENNGGAKLRITATFTESVAYPPGYKFALFEKSRSFTVPGESHPVAETTSFSTNNTWEVTTIKDFATNQQIPLPVGEYYAGISVTKDYNSVYTSGVSNTLQLNNDFTVNVQPIKGICGRNDGKLNVTINCGNGIFAIFLYKRPDNSPYRVIGSAPNFLQTRNNLIENLAAGTYDILVQELNKDGSYRRSAEMKNIILGDLPIPIKAITNKSSYCPGEQITLSAANVPAGSTYDWVGVPTDQKSQASPSFKLPSSPGYYRYFVGGKSGLCDLQVDTALVFIRTPPVLVMGTNSTDDGVGKIDTGDDLKVWVNQVFDQPYTYEWRFNKVTTVIGTNREQTVLNVTAANTGTYKVNIVDQYGCTNSDSIKVRIKPLNCGLTILPTKVCYIENNRRYGKLQVNVVNITRNWSTFLKITKVKNADDEAIDSLFVNEFQAYTASSFQKVYDKISDGTYKIEALTKRIADQMTADTCRASAVIFLQVCQKKCGPMNHYINCGVTPTLDLTQEIFRETLAQGNIIAAADFDVNVQSATKVTNLTNASLNNYTFDGLGYIQVPYLNFVKVKVEMKQAVFNECNQLVSGTVLTTYDPNWKGVVNVGETADDVTAIYKELKDLTQALVNVNLGTLEERKAKGMAKQLLDTNNDLPKSLVDTKNELASRLTDINKKCNNGTYAQAECDTANAQYKKDIKQWQDDVDKFKDDYVRIVQLALTQILNEANAAANGQKLERDNKGAVLGFQTNETGTFLGGVPAGTIIVDEEELIPLTTTLTEAYFDSEIQYNETMIRKYVSDAVKGNRQSMIDLANRLKQSGTTKKLAEYIFEELKKGTPDANIVAPVVKQTILDDIKRILFQNVYLKK